MGADQKINNSAVKQVRNNEEHPPRLPRWRAEVQQHRAAHRKEIWQNYEVPPIAKLRPSFLREVEAAAKQLKCKPLHLLAVMSFETGGTFKPSERCKADGKAVGLIQFRAPAAAKLGYTLDDLAGMTRVQQLKCVVKYLKPHRGKLYCLENLFMAVLAPAYIDNTGNSTVISAKKAPDTFRANKGLDTNKDRKISKTESIQGLLRAHLEKVKKIYCDRKGNLISV